MRESIEMTDICSANGGNDSSSLENRSYEKRGGEKKSPISNDQWDQWVEYQNLVKG